MKKLFNNPDAIHIVVNPRTGEKYAIPRSVKPGFYTIDDLIPVENATTTSCFTVTEIWDMIIKNAWSNGEPGVLFEDEINRANPTPHIGLIQATNPCGEQPLLSYEVCTLGSINVSKFVNKNSGSIDYESLARATKSAVRFLDNTIEVNHYPVPEVKEVTLANRKIGLGIMGFADTLILLGIRYDSEEAVNFALKLSSFIQEHAHESSEKLAKERGCFPNWKGSLWDIKYNRPMRNAAVTTIAPTGSISVIAGCSSGIEPVFSFAYKRRALDGCEFVQIHPLLENIGTEQGWLTDKVRSLLVQGIPPKQISEIPKKLADVLVTAHEVKPEDHVRIQATFQKYTDNAVSKTVNLPPDATVEDVDKIFRLAHQLGCKGLTVYRDGCRENQVLTTLHKKEPVRVELITPRQRNRKAKGETTKFTMGCGKLYVSVNKDDQGLCEVFSNLGKAGGCPAQSEATCRVVSAALRSGVEPKVLIEQLKGIRCLSTISQRKTNKAIDVLSCPDAIARAIQDALGNNYEAIENSLGNKCPDCSFPLRREGCCKFCDNCGYSKCG